MKYKRFYILILMILFIFIGSNAIFATENLETNELNENDETINTINSEVNEFENAKYAISVGNSNESYATLNISNVTLGSDTYYYYIATSDDEISINDDNWINLTRTNIDITEYYELNFEKFYLWVKKDYKNSENETESKILVNAQELQRVAQKPLGTRLPAKFIGGNTTIFCSMPYSLNRTSKVNYKIGEVTDENILKSIKNAESNSLQKLLDYAKSAKNAKSGSVDLVKMHSINSTFGVKDRKYYFVYLEVDDENGKYYPIEDVSLYQAYVSTSVNLHDYLSDKFKWELSESTDKEDNTDDKDIIYNDDKDDTKSPTPIPQTGRKIYIYLVIIFTLALVIVIFRKLKKYNGIDKL